MAKKEKTGNWFARHKVLTVILAIIVVIIIASALGGDKKSTSNSSSSNTANSAAEKAYRFNDRADKQKNDVEILPGESATIDGIKMTVNTVNYTSSPTSYTTADSGKIYVVANVSIENVSSTTHSYNELDFRIQTASGQVLDTSIAGDNSLSSGDLVAGGKASGTISFEVPQENAAQYIIWKPSAVHSDRAMVQIKQ